MGLVSCSQFYNQMNADAIVNDQAIKLYQEAQEEGDKGAKGFQKAIDLLDKANQIEPKNAMILHERGLIKIHSRIDIDGGFVDLKKSIDFSKDNKGRQIRYNNRALCYLEIDDTVKACDDWSKAGHEGKEYMEKYCK